jgi:hypothetical protein
MNNQVAIVAQIRPGKRAQLVELLAAGPPFDLAAHGFTRHQALLGERTVVFVFEGDRAIANVRDLASSLPLSTMTRMGSLVGSAQVLSETFDWSTAAA